MKIHILKTRPFQGVQAEKNGSIFGNSEIFGFEFYSVNWHVQHLEALLIQLRNVYIIFCTNIQITAFFFFFSAVLQNVTLGRYLIFSSH